MSKIGAAVIEATERTGKLLDELTANELVPTHLPTGSHNWITKSAKTYGVGA